MTDTSIRISTENRNKLKRLTTTEAGDTYDEVIATLVEESDYE